jgi:lipopolysaccharide transport system ATP-binding protein
MNDEAVIQVEHVSKKFCKNLKTSMRYGIEDIGRNAVGMPSHCEQLREQEFWAVGDVSFEVKRGETLGIIGPNGSGKTTLLKMLNGIFWPDRGKITIKGKVGALIEVGAGFHPLLTGRENVYVNAAILGMTRREVDERFDSIVEFADIGDFLDTPVKHYSSGMFVRLGFAVAVHCEPDILLVDEILSVGDLSFALKCYRKIHELKQRGTTVVLVSHSLQLIRNTCKKVIWLSSGKIKANGEVQHVCDLYERGVISESAYEGMNKNVYYDPKARISKVEFLDINDQICTNHKIGDHFKLRIHFNCMRAVNEPIFTVSIFNPEGLVVSSNYSNLDGYNLVSILGKGYVDFCICKLPLKASQYVCSITFAEGEVANVLEWHEKCYAFTVSEGSTNYGLINPFPKWSLKHYDEGDQDRGQIKFE